MGRLKEYALIEKGMTPIHCSLIVEHIDDIKDMLNAGFSRKQIVQCLEEIGVQINYVYFCRKLREMNIDVDKDSLAKKENIRTKRKIEL